MKKILSLILAIAVILSIGTISAFASESSINVVFKDAEGNVLTELAPNTTYTMEVAITADAAMTDGMMMFTLEGLKDIELTGITNADLGNCGIVPLDETILYLSIYGNGENTEYVATCAITTLDAGTATISVIMDAEEGSSMYNGDGDEVPFGAVNGNSIEIKAAGSDEPELAEEEVAVTDSKVVAAAEEDTDFEYGTGVMLQFTKKADFTNMIWAFTTEADEKLYSAAKAIDLAGIDNGVDVILTASFANGNKALYGYDEVAPVAIKAVNAIFKAGEAEYFTDLTDKK